MSGASNMEEERLIPISALQHLAYCPRQFALIHLEQAWEENRFTAEGRLLHRVVDAGASETRHDLHIARGVHLICHALGLVGKADVVEFHRAESGCTLPGQEGFWRPCPVEYKRGRSKQANWDRIQLCAQALALEEQFDLAIEEGALFYGKQRRRERVTFDHPLRQQTRQLAHQAHALLKEATLPPPEPGTKCMHCSLETVCLPGRKDAQAYLDRVLTP